ncbi:hypothetical protein BDP27DRAFT_1310417 [Rhodocollybia butyracea]|uniref:Uncharacterized protein n=1 Tax=Rhodocollybia butyracea TaxID=206335 RepID=A0A9P5QC59_9AGAR|nr:hypothetical protein BDP27DRAFT_1310417 [Rhodocollybia butyracea]
MTLFFWPLLIFHASLFCLTNAFNISIHSTATVPLLSTLSWAREPGDPLIFQIIIKDTAVPDFPLVILPIVPLSEKGTIPLPFNDHGEITIQAVAHNGSLIITLGFIHVIANSSSVTPSPTPVIPAKTTATITSSHSSTAATEKPTSSGNSTTSITTNDTTSTSPLPSVSSTEKPTTSKNSTLSTTTTSITSTFLPPSVSTKKSPSSGISTPNTTTITSTSSNSISNKHQIAGVGSSTNPQSSDVVTATSEDSSQLTLSTGSGIPPAIGSSSHAKSATPASTSNTATSSSSENPIPTGTQDSQTTLAKHTAVIMGTSIGAFLAVAGSVGTAVFIVLRRRRHRRNGGLRKLSLGSNAFSYQALGRSSSRGLRDSQSAAAREINVGSPWSSRSLRRIRSLIRPGGTQYQDLPSNSGDAKVLQDVPGVGFQHGSRMEDHADSIPEAWWNDSHDRTQGVSTSQSTARINATGSMVNVTLNAYDALTHAQRLQTDQPQGALDENHDLGTRDISLPLEADADSSHFRRKSSASKTRSRTNTLLSLQSLWADSDPSRASREFRKFIDDVEARWAMEGYLEPIAPDEGPPSYIPGEPSGSNV